MAVDAVVKRAGAAAAKAAETLKVAPPPPPTPRPAAPPTAFEPTKAIPPVVIDPNGSGPAATGGKSAAEFIRYGGLPPQTDFAQTASENIPPSQVSPPGGGFGSVPAGSTITIGGYSRGTSTPGVEPTDTGPRDFSVVQVQAEYVAETPTGQVKLFGGSRVNYQLKVPSGDYLRGIENGTIPPPNLYQPETIPQGGSVTFNAELFFGVEAEAKLKTKYADLWAGTKSTVSAGATFSVSRDINDPNKVQVMMGPTVAIEHELAFGISKGGASAGVGSKSAVRDYSLEVREFDIGTPEGKAAYEQFMRTGELPASGEGVRTGKLTQTSYTAEQFAQLEIGDVSATWAEGGHGGTGKTIEWSDGVRELEYTMESGGDEKTTWSQKTRVATSVDGREERIVLEEKIQTTSGVLPATANKLAAAFGQPEWKGGEAQSQINLTDDEANRWIALAQEELAARAAAGRIPLGEESFTYQIAQAKNPNELAEIIQRADPSVFSRDLIFLAQRNGGKMPGTLYLRNEG